MRAGAANLGLGSVAVLSLALNLIGVSWGLPSRWHPDEKADVAARMVAGQGGDPGSFINPSLPLYVMAPVIYLQDRAASAGLLRGSMSDPLFAGRVLAGLAAAAAILLLGLAVRRTHPELGLVPPLLLAVMPGFVNLAHFATPEAWFLLGTSATLLAAVRHVEDRCPLWALGGILGLTASTKYTAVALALPVLAAVLMRSRKAPGPRDRWVLLLGAALLASLGILLLLPTGTALAASLRLEDARLLHPESARSFVSGLGRKALASGLGLGALVLGAVYPRTRERVSFFACREIALVAVAAIVGFFVGTPFAALEPRRFLSDLAFDDQTRFEYKGLTGDSTSFGAYLGLAAEATTTPLLLTAVLGLAVAAGRVRHGSRATLLVVLAAVAPYLLLSTGGHRAMRFVAPMLPPLAWLAALALRAITPQVPRLAATVLVASRAAVAALLVVRLFLVDSRILAERWMAANIPTGTTVDLIANHAGYAPRFPPGLSLRVVPTLSREMAPPERFEEAASRYPVEASGWLVLTASFYERFLDHPEQAPERARFFSELLEGRGGFEVVARFRQEGLWRPPAEFLDPEIVILQRRSTAP